MNTDKMNIIIETIDNEEPAHHWRMLKNVTGKVVLDLGCAPAALNMQSTAEYFISQGALRCVGVDVWTQTTSSPNLELIDRGITCGQDLTNLLTRVAPQIVKCDIEESEKFFHDVDPVAFCIPDEYAIETHYTDELYASIQSLLVERGYVIRGLYQSVDFPMCRVVWASKLSQE